MFASLNLERILFLDIETVPLVQDYASLPEAWKPLWDKKYATLKGRDVSLGEEDTPASQYARAGIFAEFGKIICISVGMLKEKEGAEKFYLKSFAGDDEKQVLEDFAALLNKHGRNM